MQSRIFVLVAAVAVVLVCWLLFRTTEPEPEPAITAQPATSSVVPLSPPGGPALPGAVGKQILRDPGPLPYRDGAPAPAPLDASAPTAAPAADH